MLDWYQRRRQIKAADKTIFIATEFLTSWRNKFRAEGTEVTQLYGQGAGMVAGMMGNRYKISVSDALDGRGLNRDQLIIAARDLLAAARTEHSGSALEAARIMALQLAFGGFLFYHMYTLLVLEMSGPSERRQAAGGLAEKLRDLAHSTVEAHIEYAKQRTEPNLTEFASTEVKGLSRDIVGPQAQNFSEATSLPEAAGTEVELSRQPLTREQRQRNIARTRDVLGRLQPGPDRELVQRRLETLEAMARVADTQAKQASQCEILTGERTKAEIQAERDAPISSTAPPMLMVNLNGYTSARNPHQPLTAHIAPVQAEQPSKQVTSGPEDHQADRKAKALALSLELMAKVEARLGHPVTLYSDQPHAVPTLSPGEPVSSFVEQHNQAIRKLLMAVLPMSPETPRQACEIVHGGPLTDAQWGELGDGWRRNWDECAELYRIVTDTQKILNDAYQKYLNA